MAREIGRLAAAICASVHRVASELRKHQGGSRSGLSGINRPVKNLNRNPLQPNQLLSQQSADRRHPKMKKTVN
jgi:hypothetical protein